MPDKLRGLLNPQLPEGICLAGVADLNSVDVSDSLLPPDLLRELHWVVSLATAVSPTVLATLTDCPNQLYFHHYRQLNNLLDRATFRLVRIIESQGGRALAIPASQIVDWQNQRAHVSHKRVAVAAGLGWLGRNNLLVTPEYGSQVRLAAVLTDQRLNWLLPAGQRNSGCGACRACIAACPAGAIQESASDFDHQACFAQLKAFQRQGYVSQYICGLCVRACPGKAAPHRA